MKLRSVGGQHTSDERLLRYYTEKVTRLSHKNEKYKKLVLDRHLNIRATLADQLSQSKLYAGELERSMEVRLTPPSTHRVSSPSFRDE